MKLVDLHITRMPGFETGGPSLRGLSPGLNVIVGDNGSGKTAACRAVSALLWPDTAGKIAGLDLRSDWITESGGLHIALNHAGRSTTPPLMPPLPESAVAGCYVITVDDLFDGSKADRELVKSVAREMAGGYEVDKVRGECGFRLSARHGAAEETMLIAAKKDHYERLGGQAFLQQEEDGLHELEEQKEAAFQAQRRVGILKQVLELRGKGEKHQQAEAALKEFPEGMDRLGGDELKQLKQLRKDERREEKVRRDAEDTLDEARRELASCNFGEGFPVEVDLAQQESRARETQRIENEITTLSGEQKSAQTRLDAAAGALESLGPPQKLAKLDTDDLDKINALYQQTQKNKDQLRDIEIQIESLQSETPENTSRQLGGGIAALRDWLRQTEPAKPLSDSARRMIFAGAGLGVLLAIILSILVSPLALLILLPLAIIVFAARQKGDIAAEDARERMKQRYEETGLPKVEKWEAQVVMDILSDLEKRLSDALHFEKNREILNEKTIKLKRLNEEAQGIGEKWRILREGIGVGLEASELSLVQLSERLAAFKKAHDDVLAMNARIEAMKTASDECLKSIHEYLLDFGECACSDADAALAELSALGKRLESSVRAKAQIKKGEKSIAHAKEKIDDLLARKESLFAGCGLANEDEVGLRRRMDLLDEYKKTHALARDMRAQVAALAGPLKEDTNLAEKPQEIIESEIIAAQAKAEELEEIIKKISRIEQDVKSALNKSGLEEAFEGVEAAREALKEKREESLLAAAGNFLLDEIKEQYRRDAQPPVLKEAARLFSVFTLGRYEFQPDLDPAGDDPGDGYYAKDARDGRLLRLDQLSRGARMQLLLAARVAFAKHAERGTSVPLLLDEALTNSDPERFRAIAASLIHLAAGEDRQILYFTCRPEDAGVWEDLAKNAGCGDIGHFDLDAIMNRTRASKRPLPKNAFPVETIPLPEGRTMDEYGPLLGVADFDPAQPLGAVHLFHLLDDPDELHRLLDIGIETWGQAETLLRHDAGSVYGLSGAEKGMRARARFLNAVSEAWRIGRGKPLTREVLSRGGVTGHFIDKVYKLSGSLNNDAAALIRALENGEVSRFRTQNIEELKGYFIEEGTLDERTPLSPEDALSRVLISMSEHVDRGDIQAEEVRDRFHRHWRD